MIKFLPLILAVVTTNALAQIILKQGMVNIGQFEISSSGILKTLPMVIFNPYIIIGMLTMAISMGLHLTVLSRVDLSFAYPFLSVSYILVLIAGYFLFSETVNIARMGGVALICVGTYFIAQS